MEEAKIGTSRIVSALVAVACIAIAYFARQEIFHLVITVIVIPLGCIWYGNEIGGFLSMPLEQEDTSGNAAGMFIVVLGWMALLAILIGVIVYMLGKP